MRGAFVVDKPLSAALRPLNYAPEVEAFRRARRGKGQLKLGSLLSSMGPAYGAVFVRIDCNQEHGIELVSQGDMFAAEPSGRVIRRDSMSKPDRHRIRRSQILIAAAGTLGENELYGRAIIADGRLVDKYVGPHAMVLTFEDEGSDLNLFVYAFLSSKIGIRAIRSASFGTKILGIRKDILAELPIPVPDDETLSRVVNLIRETVVQREKYAEHLRAARKVIEDLSAMKGALAMCAERRAQCLAWHGALPTLQGWTYASTGGALPYLQKEWRGRLADILEDHGLFNGPRFARIDVRAPHGIEFMSQRDVFLMRPVPRRIRHPEVDEHKLYVPEGSLLVGGHGTLGEGEIFGRSVYVSKRFARSAYTQDLLRIQPRQDHQQAAFAFLSTTVGVRLLRSTGVGTKLLTMREDLLRALPFPDLGTAQAKAVREHVIAAGAARDKAEESEMSATEIIEKEVLPQWLES